MDEGGWVIVKFGLFVQREITISHTKNTKRTIVKLTCTYPLAGRNIPILMHIGYLLCQQKAPTGLNSQ
jgi:hypothetical protein